MGAAPHTHTHTHHCVHRTAHRTPRTLLSWYDVSGNSHAGTYYTADYPELQARVIRFRHSARVLNNRTLKKLGFADREEWHSLTHSHTHTLTHSHTHTLTHSHTHTLTHSHTHGIPQHACASWEELACADRSLARSLAVFAVVQARACRNYVRITRLKSLRARRYVYA
jgi:hypothetical protein